MKTPEILWLHASERLLIEFLINFSAQLIDTNVLKHEKNECFIKTAAVNTHLHVRSHNTVDACDFQKTDRSKILHLVVH